MKTIDRYLCWNFLTSLLGVLFIVGLVILIEEIRNIYGDILSGNSDAKWVATYLALVMPQKLGEVTPLVTAVAVLWTLMRLSRQNELLAFFCGGLSPSRVSAPFLGVAAAISVGLFILNEGVLHRTQEFADTVFRVHIKGESQTYLTRGQRVYQKGANRQFYTMDSYSSTNREMSRPTILIMDENESRPITKIEAFKASLYGRPEDSIWRFYDVFVWSYSSSGPIVPVSMEHKDFLDLKMERDLTTFLAQPGDPTHMTFVGLFERIRALQRRGQEVPRLLTELHLKIAFPLAPFVVTLLVCSFALHPKAGKAFVQFGSGVALVLGYYIVTIFLRKLGHRMVIPPLLAAWTPNLIFMLLGGQWFLRHTVARK